MKLLGGWDSSTDEMKKLDNRIYVGNEDLLFKMQEGITAVSRPVRAATSTNTITCREDTNS